MRSSRLLFLAPCLCLVAASIGATDAAPAFPLWDGHETIAQYARRLNLPETQALDLGDGVSLELVLIPAGKFIMGTPDPRPVNEGAFRGDIVTGQAVLAAGGAILLVLICFAVLRAIREKRRFQYSLRRFLAMMLAASLCVLGAMHWWHSQRRLEEARAAHYAAIFRYKDADKPEKPAHEVTISKPFYMGKYDVTQEQYQQVMGLNPSYFKGPNLPVERVTWDEAKEFCRKVNERSPGVSPARTVAGETPAVRLPTEAQWEYACRAGTVTTYYSGDNEADLARVGWYGANSGGSTHPVGQKKPNAWGLYDLHGMVFQWCEDWYSNYSIGAATRAKGAGTGTLRVLRGGSCDSRAWNCRAAHHYGYLPVHRCVDYGFRPVMLATGTP